MRHRYDEFRARGTDVLVLTFEPLERAERYLAADDVAFPVLSDPERRVYRAYGLEQGALWRWLLPPVWLGYARLLGEGRRLQRPRADPLQLGGDFVVDPSGRLALAHPAADPADRPTVADLLAVVRRGSLVGTHARE